MFIWINIEKTTVIFITLLSFFLITSHAVSSLLLFYLKKMNILFRNILRMSCDVWKETVVAEQDKMKKETTEYNSELGHFELLLDYDDDDDLVCDNIIARHFILLIDSAFFCIISVIVNILRIVRNQTKHKNQKQIWVVEWLFHLNKWINISINHKIQFNHLIMLVNNQHQQKKIYNMIQMCKFIQERLYLKRIFFF